MKQKIKTWTDRYPGWTLLLALMAVGLLLSALPDSKPSGGRYHCKGDAEACAAYFDGLDRPGPGEGGW